jgi:hypothetical protein
LRRSVRRTTAVGVAIAVALSLVCFGLPAVVVASALSTRQQISSQQSPDGRLVLVVADAEDVTVEVHRYTFGVLRWHRTLASGRSADLPVVRWVDNRTVAINGRRLDVFNDPDIELQSSEGD